MGPSLLLAGHSQATCRHASRRPVLRAVPAHLSPHHSRPRQRQRHHPTTIPSHTPVHRRLRLQHHNSWKQRPVHPLVYTELRHYSNTSTNPATPPDPSNPYTSYRFDSSFETGCSYNGYPLVVGVGRGSKYSREPQGNNSLQLTAPGCAAMVASRAFTIASVPVLLFAAGFTMWMATQTAELVATLERGGRLYAYDMEDAASGDFGNATRILVCVVSALYVPLFVCLLVWATAAEFRSAGGQWDGNLYAYVVSVAVVPVVLWSVQLYERRTVAELRRKVERQTEESDVPGMGNPWAVAADDEPHTVPNVGDGGKLLMGSTRME